MIVEGSKPNKPPVDFNKLFEDTLKGELNEDVARRTLGKFLMFNLGICVRFLTGFRLYPDQRLLLKGWLARNHSLMIASRGASKCIDEDSLVLTENGFKAIKNVEVGEKIWANAGLQEIEDKVINPKEKGLLIKTAMGYECKGKMGHKIYCLNPETFELEWKNIEDLTGKEIVPIRYGMDQWSDKNPIEGFIPNVRRQGKKLSLKHEADLYYLVGMIIGDGCLRGKPSAISVMTADAEIQDFLARKVPEYIQGSRISLFEAPGNKAKSCEFYSVAFRQFLSYIGVSGEKAHAKVFPEKLKGLNKVNMSAFLRGLYDTDGYASLRHYEKRNRWSLSVGFSSSSYALIKDVQSILLNYGIVASLQHHHKGGLRRFSNGKDYVTRDGWSLTIRNKKHLEIFNQHIGFGLKRKQAVVDQYLAQVKGNDFHFNLVPIGHYLKQRYNRFTSLRFDCDYKAVSVNRLRQLLTAGVLTKDDTRKIKALTDTDYYFAPIEAISPIETVSIDIQVANEACYWSGGFINHNSWTFSHFCYLYCIFNPSKTVVMIAPNFRSSRKIVENIEKWALSKRGVLLRQCIKPQTTGMLASKKPDVWSIEFKNGSRIISLPLGSDGESLRGYRASVLGIDEGLRIPQSIIDTVLKPFLVAIPEEETLRRQQIAEREDDLIRAGKMKPEERRKWGSDAKMIILSSASYAWEDLFNTYKSYLKKIYAADDEMLKKMSEDERKKIEEDEEARAEVAKGADIASTYLVQQFSYKAIPPERIDASIREEIESGMYSQSTIEREYEAKFVQDSDGYFKAKTMEECTLHGSMSPCPELTGERGAEYILGIDPNMSGSENNDHFAMCVLKIVTQKREGEEARKVGLVVHQYANAGAKLEHHIAYLYYVLRSFNIVYLACDTSQGDNSDFINIANESEMFKRGKLSLLPMDVDFGKESFDHLVEQIQRSYNKMEGRIVHKQYFHSAFQRAANEYLQASFNRRTILFPARITENEAALDRARSVRPDIVNTHPDFISRMEAANGTVGEFGNHEDFIERQDTLVDLVKKECALIQINVSSLGNVSFDLPQHIKRQNKSRSRPRKDSYSALFLANWALKLYLEAQERPFEQYDTFYAVSVPRR